MHAENDDFGLDLSDEDGEGVSAVVANSHELTGEDARAEGAAASAAEAGDDVAAAVETSALDGTDDVQADAEPDAGAVGSEPAPPVAAATADAPMPDATVPESEGAGNVNAGAATTATTTDEGPVRLQAALVALRVKRSWGLIFVVALLLAFYAPR